MQYVVCSAIVLSCITSWAQTPPVKPQFEVATVKPAVNNWKNPRTTSFVRELACVGQRPGEIPTRGTDRVRLQNCSLLNLIATAYGVRTTQVSGPDWLADQGFDVEAKVPDGTPKEALNAMLQSLLEERFGLKVHRDTKTSPGFALVVGKDGPKLAATAPPPPPAAKELTEGEQKAQTEQLKAKLQKQVQADRERSQEVGPNSYQGWSAITMDELAAQLVKTAGAPVVDETGLTGEYKVRIETWQNPDVPGGSIFDAVEKLGLKLEPRKVRVETVVVDKASRMPSEN
jgi:uncharacterized protein (TIGR03435 family)